jgi:hypothetical protein
MAANTREEALRRVRVYKRGVVWASLAATVAFAVAAAHHVVGVTARAAGAGNPAAGTPAPSVGANAPAWGDTTPNFGAPAPQGSFGFANPPPTPPIGQSTLS